MHKSCFGSAICHNVNSPQCAGCDDKAWCAETAYSVLIDMRDKVDIESLMARYYRNAPRYGFQPNEKHAPKRNFKVKLTLQQGELLAKAPDNIADLVKSLLNAGIDGEYLNDCLCRRTSPFEKVFPDLILNEAFFSIWRGDRRGELALALVRNQGFDSADNAVKTENKILATFVYLGVTKNIKRKFQHVERK